MPQFVTVTREQFFAYVGPLNVHPRAEPTFSIWEGVNDRRIVGKTEPGYRNGWTTEGKAPSVYMLTPEAARSVAPLPAKSEAPRVFDRDAAPELFTVFAGSAEFAIDETLMCAGPMSRGDTLADLDWSDAGEVENFQDGADVMERICTLLGARFPMNDGAIRYPLDFPPAPDGEPPLYVVFNGHAFFACTVPGFVGDLQAAYIEDDGSIDWKDGAVDVDPSAIEADESETIRRICLCLGARFPGN